MQNNLLYMCVGLSWFLLVPSITLTIFSRFKHTKFKQRLLHFLNLALVMQLGIGALYIMSASEQSTVVSYWVLLLAQIICNLFCYTSVKRRVANIRSSLDYFSMD